ncbi:MAG: aldolase/citrate lyase family protein, partial [Acidimicrobiia bacterium]
TGVLPERTPLLPALAMALLGAREAGKAILDGVYNDVQDADGFRAEAEQGKAMGFDGKTLVHPSQVGPANEVWAPSENEIDFSRRVIAAFEEAEAEGRGVITVDGRMIENLHVENAKRILAVADAIAALG